MKTTVEVPDGLFRAAKEYAAHHGMPLREVFERALSALIEGSPAVGRPFRLKTITTKGKGAASDDWSAVRALIYEGHGA